MPTCHLPLASSVCRRGVPKPFVLFLCQGLTPVPPDLGCAVAEAALQRVQLPRAK